MIKKSFTLRVLVVSFLLIALPLLVDSFIFFQNSYYEAIADAKRVLRTEVNYRTYNLLSIQPIRQVLLSELIYVMDLGEGLDTFDQKKMNRALAEVVHVGGEFQMAILRIEEDQRLKIVASSLHALVNTYFHDYEQLQPIVQAGEGTFIRYIYSEETKQYIPYVFTARVIKSNSTNRPIGLIMGYAIIEKQLNALTAKAPIQENVLFALLNIDGVVFAASDPALIGQYFQPLSPQRRSAIQSSGEIGLQELSHEPLPVIKSNDPPFFEFIFNDQVQIAYKALAPIGGISLMSYSPKEAFFGTAVRHFLLIYTIYGLILVIGGGVTYWLSLWISRPLRQLSHLMSQVSLGKLDARFKEEPLGFEINILGKLFNQTLDNLLENIQRAEDERVKKETYQRELSIVRQVQSNLLPNKTPTIKGAEFGGMYIPAIDVGGDYYDYLTKTTATGEEAVIISVADAAGRGISSCLYALSARGLFRTHATLSDDIGEILSKANNAFIQDAGNTGMFVTIFYAMYHVGSKILTYYSCGHIPGFVKKADGKIITLTSPGIAIGLNEAGRYSPSSTQLLSGDIVVLYTDGLIDAMNEKKEPYTEDRLKTLLLAKSWKSAQEVVEGIQAEVEEFTNALPQEDEIIGVVLKVN